MSRSLYCQGFLLLLLLCGCHGTLAAIAVNNLDQPVSITDLWQFKAGDDPLWSAPDLDDSGWHTLDSLSSPSENHDENAGLGWYRLTIQFDLGDAAVQRQLGALGVSIGGVASELTDSDIQQLLNQLEQEVADSNPAAEETVDQLLQGMGEDAPLYKSVVAIRDAIDIYDFATAGEQLALARKVSTA